MFTACYREIPIDIWISRTSPISQQQATSREIMTLRVGSARHQWRELFTSPHIHTELTENGICIGGKSSEHSHSLQLTRTYRASHLKTPATPSARSEICTVVAEFAELHVQGWILTFGWILNIWPGLGFSSPGHEHNNTTHEGKEGRSFDQLVCHRGTAGNSVGMSQKERPTFYRQELNKTIWEVPERYQSLSPVGSGAYGSVW